MKMLGEKANARLKAIPAWLLPWLLPVVIVIVVVSAVNTLLLLAVALVAVGAAVRWRYLEVRERELEGTHDWTRWRTDSILRRAAAKYNDRR